MNKQLYISAYVKGKSDEQREIYALASQGIVDRDREIVRWNAWEGGLADFLAHPILMVSHRYENLWVGRVTSIDPRRDGLYFRATFATSAEGEACWELVKSTGLAAFSVGFSPIESSMVKVRQLEPAERKSALALGMTETDTVKVFTRVKLLEISMVSVPACPTALLQAWKSKAVKTKGLMDALQNWQNEIDLAEIGPMIDKAAAQAIAKANVPGLIAGAVKERAREIRNEEWREYLLNKIMADVRARQADEQKAEAQRREIARTSDPDLSSPAQVEAYLKAQLATLDVEGLVDKTIRVAIAKARGRVF